MRLGLFIATALFLICGRDARGGKDPTIPPAKPPAGPGNCYYSENCTGATKAISVSANYCLQIGGKSWRPNRPKVCYKLSPLTLISAAHKI